MLAYTCLLYGKELFIIDERNTTKTCHRCGQKQPVPLWQRVYRCRNCGLLMGRDDNSAINIYQRFLAGLRLNVEAGPPYGVLHESAAIENMLGTFRLERQHNVSAVKTVETFMTALQSGDLELAASLMSDDFILGGLTPTPLTKPEFLALQSALLAAMPDFSFNLSDVHRIDDEVQALIRITGTHTGDLSLPIYGLQAVAATGLAVVLPQVEAAFQFEHDKIVGMRVESVTGGGLTGLLQQIGAELPLQPRISNITNLSE